jgi:predicted small lipoprotein YifL
MVCMRRLALVALLLLTGGSLTGCGQKGPLFLPRTQAHATPASATSVAFAASVAPAAATTIVAPASAATAAAPAPASSD